MKDQHRSLLAAALSFLVLIGWYYFFGSKMKPSTPPAAVSGPASPLAQNTTTPPSMPATPSSVASELQPESRVTKETPLMTLEWTNRGARLSKILLKKYKQDVTKDSPPINLLPFEGEKSLELVCRDCSAALPADDLYAAGP